MIRSILPVFLTLLLATKGLASSEIIELINRGEIEEARELIVKSTSASRRDGTILFAQALIEQNGARSMELLKAGESAGIDPEYKETAERLKADFYLAKHEYKQVGEIAGNYLKQYENGKYRNQMMRMAALSYELEGFPEKAENLRTKLAKENPDSEYGSIGKLDRASYLFNAKKYDETAKLCRKLSSSKADIISAPATYLLSLSVLKQGEVDNAIFHYNLLKEQYTDAIGLDELMDEMGQIESRMDDQNAEKITGTIYSIQAGVFSNRDNAKNLAKRMKQFGETVEIKDKNISGKKYFVVFVGKFSSTDKAMAFKSRLEKSEKEAFQVVAR
jgi:tetratricopeptide (TPR) repeat protein